MSRKEWQNSFINQLMRNLSLFLGVWHQASRKRKRWALRHVKHSTTQQGYVARTTEGAVKLIFNDISGVLTVLRGPVVM